MSRPPARKPARATTAGSAAPARAPGRATGRGPASPKAMACACGGRCPSCLATTAAQGEAALSSAPGTPLDAPTRQWMEQRFGHSFEGVRVHADGPAQAAAQALSTRAFAVGQHIAFAPGHYQPGSTSGRRLLAHELAHTLQQGRGGGVHARGEPAAEAAAANVLAGRPVAAQPGHATSVQRDGPALPSPWDYRPQMSAPPLGDYTIGTPVRVDDDNFIVPLSTGQRFRVRRRQWTTTEAAGSSGSGSFVRPGAGADHSELWLEVEWCEGASEGTIRLSADAPEQLVRAIGNAVLSGGDIGAAIAGMDLTPELSADFSVGTVRFHLGAEATIGIDGEVSGAGGRVGVEFDVPGGRLDVSAGVRSEREGAGELPPPTVEVGVSYRFGETATAPSCTRQHHARVLRHQAFECAEIIDVPERSREVTEHVPETERRTRHLYFPYWSSTIDGRRSAAEQALIRSDMAAGFAVASVEGYASPEGSLEAGPRFEGNAALSAARADAARAWLATACGDRGEACLPAAVAAEGRGERHTLFETGPDGVPREAEGDEQADHAAAVFSAGPAEADQRTPADEAALARARTPAARAAVVYPHLRRVDVVLTQTRTVERVRTEVTPATTFEREVIGGCPDRLREAAFPAGGSTHRRGHSR